MPSTFRVVMLATVIVVLAAACGTQDEPVADVDVGQAASETSTTATTATGESASGSDGPERIDCPPVPADYRNQELPQPEFGAEDLRCADFGGAELAQPDLVGTDLSGASFADAVLAQPTIVDVRAVGADFAGAALTQGSVADSDFTGALLVDAAVVDLTWANTICPNGVNSDELGGSCAGGLTPVESSDSAEATDAAPDGGDESDDGGLASCVGFHTGTYDGDDSGPFAIEIAADGTISSAFVSPVALNITTANAAELLAEADLEIGRDILIDGGEVRIAPEALRVTADGVTLGTLPIELQPIGAVNADGTVQAIATTGALVTGGFDWPTCSGTGTWTNGGLAGSWQTG